MRRHVPFTSRKTLFASKPYMGIGDAETQTPGMLRKPGDLPYVSPRPKKFERLATHDTLNGSRPNLRQREPDGRIVPTPPNRLGQKCEHEEMCPKEKKHTHNYTYTYENYSCSDLLPISRGSTLATAFKTRRPEPTEEPGCRIIMIRRWYNLGNRDWYPQKLNLNNITCLVSVFLCKWRSVLSHLTGGSLREKAFGDRREWRNVLSHLTARKGTWHRREWLNVLSHLTVG